MADAPNPAAPTVETPVVVVPAGAPAVEAAPVAVEPSAPIEAAPIAAIEEVSPAPEAPAVEAVVEAAAAEAPPVEAKVEAPAEEAAAEAGPEVAEPPKYELKFADDFKADPAKIGAYTDILAKHGVPPEAAQEIFDLHQKSAQEFVAAQVQRQQDVWAETNQKWVKQGEKRFGNRYNTMLNDARAVISDIFPDKKERSEFWEVLGMTGAGNHPATMLAFARVAKRLGERSAPSSGLPANARGGAPWERRYGAPKSQ